MHHVSLKRFDGLGARLSGVPGPFAASFANGGEPGSTVAAEALRRRRLFQLIRLGVI